MSGNNNNNNSSEAAAVAADPELQTVSSVSTEPSAVVPLSIDTACQGVCVCRENCLANKKRKFMTDDSSTAKKAHTDESAAISTSATAMNTSANDNNSSTTNAADNKLQRMSSACRTILECIGEDPHRQGLVKTPERWAKALLDMCSGYHLSPEQVTNNAVFDENHSEMVVVRNIDIHSLCEHHMLPFTGRVHIGYIPNGRILGLSKLARISELYARRLQVQERLTKQIANAVVETIQPLGVAVVVECTHFCMVMRGVQKTGALTTTSSVRGCFEKDPKTRAEFFSILNGNSHGLS